MRTGTHRVAAAAGLEADQAAVRSRSADRSAAIGAVRRRNDPRCHGRGGSPARTAGCSLEVPRIASRPEELGLGHVGEAEFRRAGLAKDHQPGGTVATRELFVLRRNEVLEQPRSAAHRFARVGGNQVLEQERHAAERAVGQTRGDRLARSRLHQVNDRVDLRVDLRRPGECLVQQLGGAHLAGAHELREAERVRGVVFRHRHDAFHSSVFRTVLIIGVSSHGCHRHLPSETSASRLSNPDH